MKRITSLSLVALVALAACGSDDGASAEGVWARASAPEQNRGAVYFDLTVSEDDTLVGASVSSDVAAEAQIHEVVTADMEADGGEMADEMSEEMSDEMSGDMDDMSSEEGSHDMDAMVMREVAGGLEMNADETVTFEPGGYHVMLLDLTDGLEVGEEFDVTLDFANADDLTLTVEVAETAP